MAVDYRDAKRLLRGGSLLEAARYYSAHNSTPFPEAYARIFRVLSPVNCSGVASASTFAVQGNNTGPTTVFHNS